MKNQQQLQQHSFYDLLAHMNWFVARMCAHYTVPGGDKKKLYSVISPTLKRVDMRKKREEKKRKKKDP